MQNSEDLGDPNFKDGLSFKMGEGKGMILWSFPIRSEGFPSYLSPP